MRWLRFTLANAEKTIDLKVDAMVDAHDKIIGGYTIYGEGRWLDGAYPFLVRANGALDYGEYAPSKERNATMKLVGLTARVGEPVHLQDVHYPADLEIVIVDDLPNKFSRC